MYSVSKRTTLKRTKSILGQVGAKNTTARGHWHQRCGSGRLYCCDATLDNATSFRRAEVNGYCCPMYLPAPVGLRLFWRFPCDWTPNTNIPRRPLEMKNKSRLQLSLLQAKRTYPLMFGIWWGDTPRFDIRSGVLADGKSTRVHPSSKLFPALSRTEQYTRSAPFGRTQRLSLSAAGEQKKDYCQFHEIDSNFPTYGDEYRKACNLARLVNLLEVNRNLTLPRLGFRMCKQMRLCGCEKCLVIKEEIYTCRKRS